MTDDNVKANLGQWGLEVVHDCENPTVDIIAVHGVAVNPKYAWRYQITDDGKPLKDAQENPLVVNWLVDEHMLPSEIPTARILCFNYGSEWFKTNTQLRIYGFGEQLLRAVHEERHGNEKAKNRPIIFIGHSFGGIVIEQAIAIGIIDGHPYADVPKCTVGVALLGVPHYGSSPAAWVTALNTIMKAGEWLGARANDTGIMEALRQDSTQLTDIVHHFLIWAGHHSVELRFFYETHKTTYGKSWPKTTEMVVTETSACIPGYPKIALATDHLKMAKYHGPENAAYIEVKNSLKVMTSHAPELGELRFNPRTFVQDNSQIPAVHLECQKALFVSWPNAELEGIQRRLGKRTKDTCEWLLSKDVYSEWVAGQQPQVLRLVGEPGMGKSMIITFLIEQLTTKLQNTPEMVLAYHFCDNRNQSSNNACAVVRQMLFQLFQQRPKHFHYLQKAYDVQGNKLFGDFHTMWRIFLEVVQNYGGGELFILLDALDECDEDSRLLIMHGLKKISKSKLNVRIFFTCRPEQDIEREHREGVDDEMKTVSLKIGKEDIDKDLVRYMEDKVPTICKRHGWGATEQTLISDTLVAKADGIFLWCSFVLEDIDKITRKGQIPAILEGLPKNLQQVYQRITKAYADGDQESARMVLELVSGARRPLKVDEMTMTYVLATDSPDTWEHATLPAPEDCDTYDDVYECCGRLLRYDKPTNTVNLVHQSAKDYLLSEYLAGEERGKKGNVDLSDKGKRENTKETNIRLNNLFLEIIFRYYGLTTFNHLGYRMVFDAEWDIDWECAWWEMDPSPAFMIYAGREWELHAKDAEGHAKQGKTDGMEGFNKFIRMSTKNSWLRRAAIDGNQPFVAWLLDPHDAENPKPANRDSADFRGWTSLQLAAKYGKDNIIEYLIETKGADPNADPPHIDGRTPIQTAAEEDRLDIVQLLLKHGADINKAPAKINGRTALQAAAEKAKIKTLEFLLQHNKLDPNVAGAHVSGVTALLAGAGSGGEWQMGKNIHRTIKQRSRLPGSAEIDTQKIADEDQQDRQQRQQEEKDHENVVCLLVNGKHQVQLIPNQFGWTALHAAVERESDEMVRDILKIPKVDFDHKADHDGTPLHSAKAKANEELAKKFEDLQGTDPCTYSKLDLDAMMKYIRAVLTRLMIKSNTERFFFIQSYIPIYHVIYSYCAEGADDQNDRPSVEQGGRRGELVYRDVDAWLKSYVKWNQKFIYDTPANNDFLTVYLREWKLFKRGAYYVGRMLRYLTRHWVKHQHELKHNDVREIAELFFHRWRAGMTFEVREAIKKEMIVIEHHINAMKNKDKRVLDAINESLGCPHQKFPQIFDRAKDYFIKFKGLDWKKEENFEVTLRDLTDEFEVQADEWTKSVPDEKKEQYIHARKRAKLLEFSADNFGTHLWTEEAADFYLDMVEPYFLAQYSGGKTAEIKKHLDHLWDLLRDDKSEAAEIAASRAQNLNAAADNADIEVNRHAGEEDTHMTNGIAQTPFKEATQATA